MAFSGHDGRSSMSGYGGGFGNSAVASLANVYAGMNLQSRIEKRLARLEAAMVRKVPTTH